MAQREQVTIGETVYYVKPFSAMEQIRIFGDLQKTILPSVGKLLNNTDGKAENMDDFVAGLTSLSSQLDGAELVKLAKMLIQPELVTANNDRVNNGEDFKLTHNKFDDVFEDMSEIIELVIFILKLNFAPFFTKYLAQFGLGLKAKVTN